LTIAVVLTNVVGNMALDQGSKHGGTDLLGKFAHPLVLVGVALLILWTLLKMTLLSHVDLSYYLPVTSVGYALNALAGWLFLGEHVSGRRWVGILLISVGAYAVGITYSGSDRKENL
jgi:drug/metabolite transporter (DMT)-like permease